MQYSVIQEGFFCGNLRKGKNPIHRIIEKLKVGSLAFRFQIKKKSTGEQIFKNRFLFKEESTAITCSFKRYR
jgi:hypothetical protein